MAQQTPGLVATVGKIDVKPGASNVIASEARLTLDVRHASDDVRMQAVENIVRQAEAIAGRRGLSVQQNTLVSQRAVAMDPFLVGEIEKALLKTGCKPHRMVSGAGHDAMVIAEKVPSAMIFIRTPGGISHDPAESVLLDDVEKAIECGLHLLEQLVSSPQLHKG
jgi:allantoate deiminase